MEIKVKPEQLEQIAKNISEMQTHSQNIQQNLNQSMFSIQMQWQGSTSQRFYGEFMRSTKLMEAYIRNLQVTEKELRRIAQKFRQADEEYQKKQTEKLKETPKKEEKHEKSWWQKGLEGAAEFIGINDTIRAVTGKDPITGEELSTKERLIAAGWTLLNFIPVGKVASLAGKGIKYVASSFGKTIVKAGKGLGEGISMVAGKAGKAAVDGIKTATHKVKEGVNFVASTAKGFADKIGSLWNKGATTVKTTFLQGNEKIQYAVKTLLEYKWIPGVGKAYVMPGVGMVREIGQHSLKDAYQYMTSKGVKGTGETTVKRQTPNQRKSEVIQNNFVKITSRTNIYNPKDIPSVRDGEFIRWFDNITLDELEIAWANPEVKKVISSRLRSPGKLHEWLMIARAPTFKRWGISAKQIQELRTPTKDVEFINPPGKHHRAPGSKRAHNEILEIIDTSLDYDTFVRRLQMWSHYRYKGGVEGLPGTLKK